MQIPARAETDLFYEIDEGSQHCFKAGTYLQEGRFGPAEFESKRREMGTRDFSAQYQQDPLPDDGGLFHWDWFKPCSSPPEFADLIMSADIAATEGGGNYTAITLWGHRDGIWYLVAAHRYQHELAKVRRIITQWNQHYDPDLVVIDKNGVGLGLISELKNQGLRHVLPAGATLSKLQRAQDIAAMVEGEKVCVLESAPGLSDFRNEVVAFPNGKTDDFVDSMTQVLRYSENAINRARQHRKPQRRGIISNDNHSSVTVRAIKIPRY